ncbi:MAG TPA: tRNA (guanosine(37)-N1)-methyltransferase TrmD [Patescibacteria group bacterium]|nr:tRNA (guanosine(37)-N1)-methyltransferase TrmD [Patescibacteria group bacterium]
MKIDILTLFPKMFAGPLSESIMWRAIDKGFAEIVIHDLREWAIDERGSVDDKPYGGGAGMLLRVDVIDKAINQLKSETLNPKSETKIILLDARGEKYTQKKAYELSKAEHLILICGHYEGVDSRVAEHLVDEIISIGDYVLTGGEIPAMVLTDSIIRLIPGVIKEESLKEESFSTDSVEYPQYTRPEDYKSWKVPKVLLSGNHAEIKKWRSDQ